VFGIGIPELIIIFIILVIPVSIAICVLLLTRHGPKKSMIMPSNAYNVGISYKTFSNSAQALQREW